MSFAMFVFFVTYAFYKKGANHSDKLAIVKFWIL